MFQEDIYTLKTVINEYGVKHSIAGMILALREYADDMSDLGLKERSTQAAEMAEALQDLLEE